jgi:hypothetical protein
MITAEKNYFKHNTNHKTSHTCHQRVANIVPIMRVIAENMISKAIIKEDIRETQLDRFISVILKYKVRKYK